MGTTTMSDVSPSSEINRRASSVAGDELQPQNLTPKGSVRRRSSFMTFRPSFSGREGALIAPRGSRANLMLRHSGSARVRRPGLRATDLSRSSGDDFVLPLLFPEPKMSPTTRNRLNTTYLNAEGLTWAKVPEFLRSLGLRMPPMATIENFRRLTEQQQNTAVLQPYHVLALIASLTASKPAGTVKDMVKTICDAEGPHLDPVQRTPPPKEKNKREDVIFPQFPASPKENTVPEDDTTQVRQRRILVQHLRKAFPDERCAEIAADTLLDEADSQLSDDSTRSFQSRTALMAVAFRSLGATGSDLLELELSSRRILLVCDQVKLTTASLILQRLRVDLDGSISFTQFKKELTIDLRALGLRSDCRGLRFMLGVTVQPVVAELVARRFPFCIEACCGRKVLQELLANRERAPTKSLSHRRTPHSPSALVADRTSPEVVSNRVQEVTHRLQSLRRHTAESELLLTSPRRPPGQASPQSARTPRVKPPGSATRRDASSALPALLTPRPPSTRRRGRATTWMFTDSSALDSL